MSSSGARPRWTAWTAASAAQDKSWHIEQQQDQQLQDAVAAIAGNAIFSGWGFSVLRGFVEPGSTSAAFNAAKDIASTLGQSHAQAPSGEHFGLLEDQGQTGWRVRQPMHTDGGDVLTLICVRPAAVGGHSLLASARTAYDYLEANHPASLHELEKPWTFSRKGRPGPRTFEKRIFEVLPSGWVHCFHIPGTARSTPMVTGIPLSSAAARALDDLDRTLDMPEHVLEVQLEAGDVLIADNRAVLHARTAYTDSPDPDQRRRLIRGWTTVDREQWRR